MPKIVDADTKRDMIAHAACRAIAKRGVSGVTMNDIAKAGGVTTGMITHYYPSKDAIIAAALRIPFHNVRQAVGRRLAAGTSDLADILDAAIPATRRHAVDSTVWVSFWGLIATDGAFRRLNAKLHAEGADVFREAVLSAWPEAACWSEDVLADALLSITTILFGLSAGGVTNPKTWSPSVQRRQLRQHLSAIRQSAAAEHAKG